MLLSIVQWQRVNRVHSDLDAVTARIYSCNKLRAYTERLTPFSSKRRPHFERRTCLGKNKNLVMDLEETETRNDCAGEGQHQFNRPTDNLKKVYVH
jgi:hypothetical protein